MVLADVGRLLATVTVRREFPQRDYGAITTRYRSSEESGGRKDFEIGLDLGLGCIC